MTFTHHRVMKLAALNIAITDRYISHLNPTAVLNYMQERKAA